MGLLIGVGASKPTYAYDYYYGIEWDTTVSTPTPTRVGKSELHASLPLQSLMRRCLLNDDGTVNYYLHANDSTRRDTSAAADLTGADGQYMVELPDVYIRFEQDGTTCRCLMSQYALPGFTLWKKDYVSAVEATVQRSTTTLCSVVNSDADYRGGNNNSSYDDEERTQLGMPASNISLTNFRTYARNRGTAEWNCYLYKTHKKLWWLFAVEYCNFNSQAAFNAELDANGYRQGGLGAGVTTVGYAAWRNFASFFPVIPCGTTNELGNHTGAVDYTMPFMYNICADCGEEYATAVEYYAGEYSESEAYTSGQYVTSGGSLYRCIADAEAGTAVTDAGCFTEITRTVVSVPSYRGVENPFGHIYKWTDGCLCSVQSDDDGGVSEFYTCDDPANCASAVDDSYELKGELPLTSGYVKSLILGDDGEIMPLEVGGGTTTYFCDYYSASVPSSGTAVRGVLFGGHAYNGATAGFVCASTNNSPASAYALVGSRLCFYPAS